MKINEKILDDNYNNFIIGELITKEPNQRIRIINSFEETNRYNLQ